MTTTLASMRDCHLRTSERNLSDVKSSPWKLVKQFLPCTSSTLSLTFRNAWSSSFCRSARETSNILPFRASFAFLRPVVLLTSVFPTLQILAISLVDLGGLCVLANLEGRWCLENVRQKPGLSYSPRTFTEYQSLRVKGSCVLFLSPFLPFERRLFLQRLLAWTKPSSTGASVLREEHSLSDSHDCGLERTLRLDGCVSMWRVDFCGQFFSEVLKKLGASRTKSPLLIFTRKRAILGNAQFLNPINPTQHTYYHYSYYYYVFK